MVALVLCGLNYYLVNFVIRSVILCCNLMTIHANWMCHALTQGIRKKLKLSLSTKKIKEAVSNVEITVIKQKQLNRRTQHQLPIFCQNFQIFCCKIEVVKKIKYWVTFWFWVWLNITLMLRFMKSNKFYCLNC